jgi:hypothetical protein
MNNREVHSFVNQALMSRTLHVSAISMACSPDIYLLVLGRAQSAGARKDEAMTSATVSTKHTEILPNRLLPWPAGVWRFKSLREF